MASESFFSLDGPLDLPPADGQVRVFRAEVERMMLSGPVKPREPALRLVNL